MLGDTIFNIRLFFFFFHVPDCVLLLSQKIRVEVGLINTVHNANFERPQSDYTVYQYLFENLRKDNR